MSGLKIEYTNEYPYIKIGSEDHGKPSYKLWLSKSFLSQADEGGNLVFPLKGRIKVTEKGSLVLKRDDNFWVYDYFCPCGFRGDSKIIIKNPKNEYTAFYYYVYSSQRGSLGVSQGALIVTSHKIVINWERTGRLYRKAANGIAILYNGTTKTYDGINDEQELKELEED